MSLPSCSAVPFDLEFIDPNECLKNSLAKINKNFSTLESLLISLSTCCSLSPCVSCPTNVSPGDTDCGNLVTYENGGVSYPAVFTFELGPATGNVTLFFNALQRPDRFICSIDGAVVLDTGYYGASRYAYGQWDRANFTNRLVGLADPITGNVYPFADSSHEIDGFPIVNPAQVDSKSFLKSTSTSTCTLCAFAPMLTTLWEINLGCPT